MFGQSNSSPFGAPPASSNPFGSSANSTPAFGSPAPAPFGSYGGNAAFGAPSTAPFGSNPAGTFGAPAQAPFGNSSGGFGGFGSTNNSSPFGAPPPAPGGLFGAPTPAPSGGIFGSSIGNTGGGFGAPNSSTFGGFGSTNSNTGGGFGAPAPSAFGAPTSSSAFGATPSAFGAPTSSAFGAPNPSAFGAPPPSGGIFGAPAPAPSFGGFGSPSPAPATGMFGAPAPSSTGGMFGSPSPLSGGGLFGAPAPASTGGMFGAPQMQHGVGAGSSVAPFQVTTRQDGTSSINLQSVSAMAQYENKSFEELRFEDYSMGNKGDGTGGNTVSGGFGFGPPASVAYGVPAPPSGGLFGVPAPAPTSFGTPAIGGFGAPATGGFGSTAFGAPSPAPGGFSFGAPAPALAFGGFGGAAPAPAGGLFGAPAPAGGLFGSTAPAPSGGLFGSPVPAPGSFGAPTTGALFGSSPAPASGGLFGGPTPAPGGLFGSLAPTPAFGGFGAKSPPPASGLFGAPAATGGLFGAAPATGGGLFGSSAPAPNSFGTMTTSGGSLFGMSAPVPSTGLFGSPTPVPPPSDYYMGQNYGGGPPPAMIIPPAADAVLTQQLAAVANQRKELEMLDVWRGQSPQQSSVVPSSLSEYESVLKISPYSTSTGMSAYRASPKSMAKIIPRGFNAAFADSESSTSVISFLGKGGSSMMSPGPLSSAKRLVTKPGVHTPKPSLRLRYTDGASDTSNDDHILQLTDTIMSPPAQENRVDISNLKLPAEAVSPATVQRSLVPESPTPAPQIISQTSTKAITPTNGTGVDFYRKVVGSPRPSTNADVNSRDLTPKLTKSTYFVTPSLPELSKMSEVELATVSGFSISREGFGSVAWEGAVDVRAVDLDAVVSIGTRDVSVYEQQEADGTKPPQGSKLNRPAIITIPKVFPKQGMNANSDDIDKYTKKLKKTTSALGAEFISYDASSGEWVFRVSHFSKYGLLDESDDEESEDDDESVPISTKLRSLVPMHKKFESGERPRCSPVKAGAVWSHEGSPTTFTVPTNGEDDDDDETDNQNLDDDDLALLSDVEMVSHDEQILDAANRAYESLTSPETTLQLGYVVSDEKVDEDWFQHEGVGLDVHYRPLPTPPTDERLLVRRPLGICARIAQSRGVLHDSETDFGLRMGRSFRIGWKPDGSILRITSGSILVQSKPKLSEIDERGSQLLEIHRQYASQTFLGSDQLPSFNFSGRSGIFSLRVALDTYSKSFSLTDNDVPTEAFDLISCLLQDSTYVPSHSLMPTHTTEPNQESFQPGGLHAFKSWVQKSCIKCAMSDINQAELSNDVFGAVFAALTSGNLETATVIASKYGYHQLSAIIAVGSTCAEYLHDQVRQWQVAGNVKFMSGDILRVYSLLGGDLKLEEQRYKCGNKSIDWKRRLGMLLFYSCDTYGGDFDIESLVEAYQSSVDRGVAPVPRSEGSPDDESCLLYRLIRIGQAIVTRKQSFNFSVSDVISPSGHARSPHDLAVSFHLAVALSEIGCCSPLSDLEMVNLYDGYAAQMISIGRWELAVYAMLCSIDKNNVQFDAWRHTRAKELVLRFFNSSSVPKRDFLVNTIGLPNAWFDECLASQAFARGDAFEFISHVSKFAPADARIAIEEIVIPSLLFRNAEETTKSLDLLESFAFDDDTLIASVLSFFRLYEGVISISLASAAEKHLVGPLTSEAIELKNKFIRHQVQANICPRSHQKFFGAFIPIKSFLAEVLSSLHFLMLQLAALQAGESIWDEEMDVDKSSVPLKLTSQLISVTKKVEFEGITARDQLFRGLV